LKTRSTNKFNYWKPRYTDKLNYW